MYVCFLYVYKLLGYIPMCRTLLFYIYVSEAERSLIALACNQRLPPLVIRAFYEDEYKSHRQRASSSPFWSMELKSVSVYSAQIKKICFQFALLKSTAQPFSTPFSKAFLVKPL